jgi:purine nucleosidase
MCGQALTRRRALLSGLAGLAACGLSLPAALAGPVMPRQRVIIDNDFSGDPDGLFQLAHHLASPSVDIALIIGSHIHVNDFLDKSAVQADNAVARVGELMSTMRLARRPPIVAGRNAAPAPGHRAEVTPAVRRIVAEAMRDDTKLPLYYAAGAGLTDIAEALSVEPRIARRLKLIWIGGMEHGDLLAGAPERRDPEYNLTIDLPAVRSVFNDSDVEIWQVPRNVYRQMIISQAELAAGLRSAGALGAFLFKQLERVSDTVGGTLGETYILGDSPLVTLTALQSSFEPDSSSSPYVLRPTPRIDADGRYVPFSGGRPMRVYTGIDTRLTFADMFIKFAKMGA